MSITIVVDPIGLGRFRASLGDRLLCERCRVQRAFRHESPSESSPA
jgi:hypothetical protein